MSDGQKFLGKFRGLVVNNIDPQQIGRIMVMVPDVSNVIPSSWAMPSLPLAGIQMGMQVIPPIGAGVWVEFEQGNPDYPIWSGCWWGSAAEVPPLALAGLPGSPNILLQTTGQNTLMISDLPGPTGGIMIKSTTGAMLLINDIGITISNGKGAIIAMIGPTVTINQGAMVIT
jgi:uncharacterized protein involved in type VI secretion and phage assembly